MPPLNEPTETPKPRPPAPRHWRSLGELAEDADFRRHAEAEFPAAAEGFVDDPAAADAAADGVSRRRLIELMGASLALAGVAGCRWEKEEILPFAARPANRLPGVVERYATAMERSGVALGLMVTTYDGRPIKIEGNPRHPSSEGATDAFAQAELLAMYDPDRAGPVQQFTAQGPLARTWEEFAAMFLPRMAEARAERGRGVAILAEPSSSPTRRRLAQQLIAAMPEARWLEYEPLSRDNERLGGRAAFDADYRTSLDLRGAECIVALDADLLGADPAAVAHARGFVRGRQAEAGRMNRLYCVESSFSVTGMAADHRLPLRAGDVAAFASTLQAEIGVLADGGKTARTADPAGRFLRAAAEDLWRHRGRSLVAAGPAQPAEVHAAVHRINAALENVGKTVLYFRDEDAPRPTHTEAIRLLSAEMAAARVKTLIILGGNPAYDAPADTGFVEALKKVPVKIRLALSVDETSLACDWHVPQAHFLESWGDVRSADGTYSVVQPTIEPLFGGRGAIELLALALGEAQPKSMDLVRRTFEGLAGPRDADIRWTQTLHNGLFEGSRLERQTPRLATRSAADRQGSANRPVIAGWKNGEPLEVVFRGDSKLYDGRYGNNAWLQEMPEAVTKLAWDNAAIVAPATAEALGLTDGAMVRLTAGGRSLELALHVLPGQAVGTVWLPLGYGRRAAGRVGGSPSAATSGFDVYPLRTTAAMWQVEGATLEPTGRAFTLAGTQHHHAIDAVGARERAKRTDALVRESDLEHYRRQPGFAKAVVHMPPLKSLWDEPAYTGHRWGMAIDLGRCTGCSACVVACQAENNVPVVGKAGVLKGREMQWLRVDRYFVGSPAAPRAALQPLPCQHCELAPCEQVCPVAATVHSAEGLNDMVYNRCVGTRYCSNNCPYKVRRFNYFNYHRALDEPGGPVTQMMYNPEVTIRARGVMEKCTYCVQRIQNAKIVAKNQRRPIADGEIRTACQQVCPTEAIVFGDLADPQSAVAKLAASNRAYGLLAEYNFKPRTFYLAKIRNPNPVLDDPADDEHRHPA